MIVVYLVIAIVAAICIAYLSSHTVRGWVQSVWQRWFKDSEVNFGADLFSVLGFVGMIVSDPTYAELFNKVGITPTTLLAVGLIIRGLKASRNVGALPMTRTEDDA